MDIFEWLKMYPEQQTVDMCHDDYTDRYIWRVTIPPEIRATKELIGTAVFCAEYLRDRLCEED